MWAYYCRMMYDRASALYRTPQRHPDRVGLGFEAMREFCAVMKYTA